MQLGNKQNQYQKALSMEFFDKCPKTVFAALAVSNMLIRNGEKFETMEADLLAEWQTLYDNGIVPQKPPKLQPHVDREKP